MKYRIRFVSRLLKACGLLVLIGTVGAWVMTGAHLGWTQTSIVTMQHDPITEIEYPVRRDGLVIGLEILAGGLSLALSLGGVGLVASRQSNSGRPRLSQ